MLACLLALTKACRNYSCFSIKQQGALNSDGVQILLKIFHPSVKTSLLQTTRKWAVSLRPSIGLIDWKGYKHDKHIYLMNNNTATRKGYNPALFSALFRREFCRRNYYTESDWCNPISLSLQRVCSHRFHFFCPSLETSGFILEGQG